jgi:putative CocE/NonD family hydrolase
MKRMPRVLLIIVLFFRLTAHVSRLTAQGEPEGFRPPAAKHEHTLEKTVMVPMRDGVKLGTDIYRPTGLSGKLPVILIRTPYGKDTYSGATNPAKMFAGQGYIVVVQDTRGKFHSEGEFKVQDDDRNDGYDTMDWIVKQPWATGKIGTYGCSYLGEVQYLLSKMRHPAHTAMIPQSASGATGSAGGYYTNFGINDGGANLLSSAFGWFGGAGSKVKGSKRPENLDFPTLLRSLPIIEMGKKAGYAPSEFEDFFIHPPGDPWWLSKGYLTDQDRFATPALHVNSWLDVTPEVTLYDFNLMRKNAATPVARDNQFIIMSPTVHCASEYAATENTKVGEMEVGDARLGYWKIYLDWFDHWLKGVDNGVTKRPKVTYFVMHKGWRTANEWPVPEATATSWYLTSGGRANTSSGNGAFATSKPAAGKDTWTYDPGNPVPSKGGTICCTGNPADVPGIFDQSALESRPDILVYTSEPLAGGLTIAGTVKLVLQVSSDAKDTDFNAKLLDVDPQGRSWNIMNGVLRARYREGMAKKVLMEPGKTYELTVSLKATAYHFRPGHRLRLHLTSSDFPLYDRNLNTGGNNYDETEFVKATNTVHYGVSRLVLPVVK